MKPIEFLTQFYKFRYLFQVSRLYDNGFYCFDLLFVGTGGLREGIFFEGRGGALFEAIGARDMRGGGPRLPDLVGKGAGGARAGGFRLGGRDEVS